MTNHNRYIQEHIEGIDELEVDMIDSKELVKRTGKDMLDLGTFLLIKMVSMHPRKPKTCLRRG